MAGLTLAVLMHCVPLLLQSLQLPERRMVYTIMNIFLNSYLEGQT